VILFSVAHSSKAKGAQSHDGMLSEYWVSLRATLAAMRNLAGEFPVEMLDVGPLNPREYASAKTVAINRCQPSLAIEIHCNASTNHAANYSEVIHHRSSVAGARAASCVAQSLADGFANSHHKSWRSRGARVNTAEHDGHLMFFLELTKVPAIIVEGVFISNMEQAAWLAGEGGCEAYGLLVADGLRRWLAGAKA
jgi:N-acetylmuramoyl-L-alanine amidase